MEVVRGIQILYSQRRSARLAETNIGWQLTFALLSFRSILSERQLSSPTQSLEIARIVGTGLQRKKIDLMAKYASRVIRKCNYQRGSLK